MDKAAIRNIIETTLRGGSRSPGPLDLLKVMAIRVELEACGSPRAAAEILARHRALITRAFGLSAAAFDAGVARIKALDDAA